MCYLRGRHEEPCKGKQRPCGQMASWPVQYPSYPPNADERKDDQVPEQQHVTEGYRVVKLDAHLAQGDVTDQITATRNILRNPD